MILDDAINAGSAVRATAADLRHRGVNVLAAATLLTVGAGAHDSCRDEDLSLITLMHLESNLWLPRDCPLCVRGEAPVDIGS